MPHRTAISWADYSSNPLRAEVDGRHGWACVRVSPGCTNCYAATLNRRLGTGLDYTVPALARGRQYVSEKELAHILSFRPKPPFKEGSRRPKVFPCDMTDLFAEHVPDEDIDRIFAAFALRPDVDFLVLTKRPARMREYLTGLEADRLQFILQERAWDLVCKYGRRGERLLQTKKRVLMGIPTPLPNVWIGTSVEDQERADERIPELLATPAAVRFLSCEPLLGPVDLARWLPSFNACQVDATTDGAVQAIRALFHAAARTLGAQIDWAIVGGESGPRFRPMEEAWAASLKAQCDAAGVAYFGKQASGRKSEIPLPGELGARAFPAGVE